MIIVLLLALMCPALPRDVKGGITRSSAAVHAFMKENPCPGGIDVGHIDKCTGHVVDHVIPLCLGGNNSKSNMQWQTTEEGRSKDAAEVALCRWYYRACGWKW